MSLLDDHIMPEHDQDAIHTMSKMKTDSKDESGALNDYSEESFPLNSYLHRRHAGSIDKNEVREHALKHLDSFMDKHKLKSDIHVYTGIPKSPTTILDKDKSSTVVHFPAFTSTSTSVWKAKNFATPTFERTDPDFGIGKDSRHILKLHLPKGTKAASIRDISNHPSENEILMGRGASVEIDHKPEEHEDKEGKIYIWHGKVHSN